ncbi:MAG: hypothetical protein KGJ81_01505 [Alphaproteobacteria bacterium]|nr:hypothetical protein [Alphaproteobacteria bacterium]
MNRLGRKQQRQILNLMCQGNGIAAIADITGCSTNTVRAYLAHFGEALTAAHDRLVRGMSPTRIEIDELWSYVYAKRERSLARENRKQPPPPDRGAFYTWVALDPDSKLFISWQVGDRSEKTGLPFLVDVNARIAPGPVLITTDGFKFYEQAIPRVFGPDGKHVVIEKNIESWRNPETGERGTRVISMKKVPKTRDKVNLSLASTSLVERLNGSIRNYISRFARQTYKFSKRLTNHVHAHAIFVMYYNFVKPHRGFKGPDRHLTPAMKAGLTNKVWTYDDLLDEVDEYWRRKALKPSLQVVPPCQHVPLERGETSPLPYFVMYSPKKRTAKVHKGSCGECKQGLGRKEGHSVQNKWFAFETERAARRFAETLAPLENSVCSKCITGSYVKHRVRSR